MMCSSKLGHAKSMSEVRIGFAYASWLLKMKDGWSRKHWEERFGHLDFERMPWATCRWGKNERRAAADTGHGACAGSPVPGKQATVALLKTLFVYARVVRVRACLRSRVGRACMNALLILIGSKTWYLLVSRGGAGPKNSRPWPFSREPPPDPLLNG
jgi:hypothetical protein